MLPVKAGLSMGARQGQKWSLALPCLPSSGLHAAAHTHTNRGVRSIRLILSPQPLILPPSSGSQQWPLSRPDASTWPHWNDLWMHCLGTAQAMAVPASHTHDLIQDNQGLGGGSRSASMALVSPGGLRSTVLQPCEQRAVQHAWSKGRNQDGARQCR